MYKTWEELIDSAHLKDADYKKQYAYIKKLESEHKIEEIRSSGTNGRQPYLCQRYKLIDNKKDLSSFLDEIKYNIHPDIHIEYYAKHLEKYVEERTYVKKLSDFLNNSSHLLDICISCNERSFQIWQEEKFLKESKGKTILKHCNIPLDKLNYYDTSEPISYYSKTTSVPQNILIIENKDTFYSMRKHLLLGETNIFDLQIGTLIYGAGKRIWNSFSSLNIVSEPYMIDKNNQFLYFGDLDYEGIYIYEKLVSLCTDIKVKPFVAAYCKMLQKGINLDLPTPSEKQNKNISNDFLSYFESQYADMIMNIFNNNHYIPQEILNINDFKS